jgi:hypothetical protein
VEQFRVNANLDPRTLKGIAEVVELLCLPCTADECFVILERFGKIRSCRVEKSLVKISVSRRRLSSALSNS